MANRVGSGKTDVKRDSKAGGADARLECREANSGRGCGNRGNCQFRFVITGRMGDGVGQRIKTFLKVGETLCGQVDYILAHIPWKKELVRPGMDLIQLRWPMTWNQSIGKGHHSNAARLIERQRILAAL